MTETRTRANSKELRLHLWRIPSIISNLDWELAGFFNNFFFYYIDHSGLGPNRSAMFLCYRYQYYFSAMFISLLCSFCQILYKSLLETECYFPLSVILSIICCIRYCFLRSCVLNLYCSTPIFSKNRFNLSLNHCSDIELRYPCPWY